MTIKEYQQLAALAEKARDSLDRTYDATEWLAFNYALITAYHCISKIRAKRKVKQK